ncbi:adhesion G-protein coupled receptor G2-like isoform X4 [Acipenser oxyrinchus oxyrinchus]|uniref:Adhesion G-protein coupled receptor G2-like isoform X4 n=1 Tax=Acipenser oxyrinchus oxyrinchus TaxID=40147 RepID=A0AAD8D6S7_ACIOX|nr:adhesion G-protein coupled receptor G2-like isoform X4 [Acipenser oxyrinchus oxyrinchus]
MVWPTWNSCVISAGLWGCVLLLTSLSAFCASLADPNGLCCDNIPIISHILKDCKSEKCPSGVSSGHNNKGKAGQDCCCLVKAVPVKSCTITSPAKTTALTLTDEEKSGSNCNCEFFVKKQNNLNHSTPSKAQTLNKKCTKNDVVNCKAYSSILQGVKNIVEETEGFDGTKKEIISEGMKGLVIKYNKHNFTDIHLALPSLGATKKDTDIIMVTISNEALQKAIGRNGSVQVGIVMFNESIFPGAQKSSLLSDEVIAIELGSPISDLTDNITITFYHADTLQDRKCVFWDVISNGSKAIWNESGCQTVKEKKQTVCSCNHLTFFAVLTNPNNITLSASTLKALTYISYIGCGVSLFFLGVTLFMYFMLRKQKSDHSTTIHQSLCSVLFLLNLTFLLNEWLASYNNDGLCQFIAALMHYSLLCTFTWFGIEAFHLYLLMIKVFNTYIKHYRMKLSLAGWGLPAVAVIVCLSLKKYGKYKIYMEEGSVSMCWLTDPAVLYVTIAYYALLFLCSVVIFSLVAVKIVQLGKSGSSLFEKGSTRRNVCTLLGLCCLLGLTWGIMFFNFGSLQVPALYAFSILNSLHGFFVFLRYYALTIDHQE